MKKLVIVALLILVAIGAGVYFYKKKPDIPPFKTAKVERGDMVAGVSATGNLTAVVTVQVGTQVSGTIQKLFADFNSPVKKGQAIAQIDPALFNSQVEQTHGNYLAAQANLQKAKADLADAKRTLERNRQLVKDGIIAQSDYDTAETRHAMSQAAVKAAEGTVVQTRGAYSQARTNLRYATITSPVNGTVVSRAIDVGQTVAASFQTPTLFTIAQDLKKMQIETSVDEADISRVTMGQPVSFTVDAYPERRFSGRVTQVRNAPVTAQNVVTYVVVVGVGNEELKLKPGMTANVTIETARKSNVLKIPAAALRFKPKSSKAESTPGEGKGKQGRSTSPKARNNGQQVYVLGPDKKAVPVAVNTGISDEGQVELLEGSLKEQDEVIIDQVQPAKKKQSGMGGSPMGPRF